MSRRRHAAIPLLVTLLIALLGAASCGGEDDTVVNPPGGGSGPGGGGGSGPGGGGTGPGGGGGSGVCEPNATAPCDCPQGVGSQRCAPAGIGWSACECTQYGAEIAVSPSGDDANPGTLASPFRTLGRAQQAVRDLVDRLKNDGLSQWL